MLPSIGFRTLFYKECQRFLRVVVQTVFTPMIMSLLYLIVFGQVLSGRVSVYDGFGYLQFLVPGLVMMGILQNAYANSSSSFFQSKINGSLDFILVAPITNIEIFIAYVLAAIIRGIMVGFGVFAVAFFVVDLPAHSYFIIFGFAFVAAGLLATLGLLVGIVAEQYEHISAFQSFLIAPLSFLSGAFYSIHSLAPIWQQLSYFNPFFYMVDGFRYGFLGSSDVSFLLSGGVLLSAWAILVIVVLYLLNIGYRIRS